jgi:two-component system alkaline phosphatase synthesis response regulator PhoP
MPRVLVIDDDENSVNSIKDTLEFEGFEVFTSGTFADAQVRALNETYDAIIIDLFSPAVGGIELVKSLRKINKIIPIIAVSEKTKEEDSVFGLNLGADDFIGKPFSTMELLARLRAHLRKINFIKAGALAGMGALNGYEPVTIKIGESLIYLDKMILKRNEQEEPLTPKELGIIRLLFKNRGKVVSRDLMMKEIWGDGVYVTERVIDTNVVSIRKKIGDMGRKPKFIKTVFGVGYKMVEY